MAKTSPPQEAEAEEPSLGAVLDFLRTLWAVDHGLQSLSKRMEAQVGVTGPQRLVIRIVGRYPGVSAGRLADILHLHPSTLTGILRRLEKGGIVSRKPDPADGRRALFDLTARGRTLDRMKTGTVEAALRKALDTQPQDRIAAAQELLAAVAEHLAPEE